MIMARPVVATRAGGTPELVNDGETGFLVAVRDSKSMAECIAELLLNPERSKSMGEAGRRRVEREFSCARMKQKLETLYDTMLLGRSRIAEFDRFRGISADQEP